jgi:hypothetical protein
MLAEPTEASARLATAVPTMAPAIRGVLFFMSSCPPYRGVGASGCRR